MGTSVKKGGIENDVQMKAISISGLATLALMLTVAVPLAFSEEKTIVGLMRDSPCLLKMDARCAARWRCPG